MERRRKALIIVGIALYFCVVNVARADEAKTYLTEDEGSVALIQKAWEALEEKDLEKVLFYPPSQNTTAF